MPLDEWNKIFGIIEEEPDSGKLGPSEWLRYLLFAEATMDSSIRLSKADRTRWLNRLWSAVLSSEASDLEWTLPERETLGLIVERLWSEKHGSLEVFLLQVRHRRAVRFFGSSVGDLRVLHGLPFKSSI